MSSFFKFLIEKQTFYKDYLGLYFWNETEMV